MKKNKKIIFAIIFYIALIIPFFTLQNFNDEYEHASSGWLIINNLMPYRDFFSHHGPLPLFLGILGYTFPANPMLVLRFWSLLFQLLVWGYLLKHSNKKTHPAIYLTMFMAALATPTFLFQMALANVFFNFGILSIIILLHSYYFYKSPKPEIIVKWLGFISILCLWSSIATVIPIVVLGFFLLLMLLKRKSLPPKKKMIKYVSTTLLSFLIFPTYFFIKGELSTFLWSVFTYNTNYYYPLRLASSADELRYGSLFRILNQFFLTLTTQASIFFTATTQYLQAILGGRALIENYGELIGYLNLITAHYWNQINFVNTLIIVLLLLLLFSWAILKKFNLVYPSIIIGASLFFRSNEVFHLGTIFLAIIFGLSWQLFEGWKANKKLLTILIGAGFIYTFLILKTEWMKTINEKPTYFLNRHTQAAEVMNAYGDSEDKIMVLDPNMIYYPISQRLPSCKYHYYLPWLHQTEKIRTEVEKCLINPETKFVVIPDASKPEVQDLWPIIEINFSPTSEGSKVFIRKDMKTTDL